MDRVLKEFAVQTKLGATIREDVSALARRYVAVRVRLAPTEIAYRSIASDYAELQVRTERPNVRAFADVDADLDVPTLTYIFKHGFKEQPNELSDSYADFVDAVFPGAPDEERWQAHERANHWKQKGYFIALNFTDNVQFHPLIKAITVDGQSDDLNTAHQTSTIESKLRGYAHQLKAGNLHKLAVDFGALISQIQLPEHDYTEYFIPIPTAAASVASATVTKSALTMIPETVEVDSDALRQILEPYRKQAQLAPVTSESRITKQMLLAALQIKAEALPRSILGRYQKMLVPVTGAVDATVITSISLSREFDPNQSLLCKAISQACNRYEWKQSELLSKIVNAETELDERQMQRYKKAIAGVDLSKDSLVQAIIAAPE